MPKRTRKKSHASATSAQAVENEGSVSFSGATGCLGGESLSEKATVIETIEEYYEIIGEKNTLQKSGAKLTEPRTDLPEIVDNSQSKYFPEVGNQGSMGSCVSWAQTYYQFTYEMNRDMDIETTPENTFSPKWTHNIANGGKASGSWDDDVYDLMLEIGNVTLADLPVDEEYLSWSPTEEIWKTAIKYRVSDYQVFKDVGKSSSKITSPDDSDLALIKTALSNGEVLAYTTYIKDYKLTHLTTNADAPENDKYNDEYVAKYLGTAVKKQLNTPK